MSSALLFVTRSRNAIHIGQGVPGSAGAETACAVLLVQ